MVKSKSGGIAFSSRLVRFSQAINALSSIPTPQQDAVEMPLKEALQPWLVRHNKGTHWADTAICRRQRLEGAAIAGYEVSTGLPIPPEQLLPFFLAARSVVDPGKDLLGEALCSSYEAFRYTRQKGSEEKDILDSENGAAQVEADFSNASWYLNEFDRALENCTGATHPKISATVARQLICGKQAKKCLCSLFIGGLAVRCVFISAVKLNAGLWKVGSVGCMMPGCRQSRKRLRAS